MVKVLNLSSIQSRGVLFLVSALEYQYLYIITASVKVVISES